MREYFKALGSDLIASLKSGEVLLLNYEGEKSDFVRLNQNRIRQAGTVSQHRLQLDLIAGNKQSGASLQLSANLTRDRRLALEYLGKLREQIDFLPEDPYLNYATSINNTEQASSAQLPDAAQVLPAVLELAQGLDMVGIWASGAILQGFCNSLGQFNWHENNNYNFDWSIYHHADKAVKQNMAGFSWDHRPLREKVRQARETLKLLAKPAKTIQPGRYRVYLTPSALNELLSLLGWGGFGLKSHKTQQTPLLKMVKDNVCINSKVHLVEDHAQGISPRFTESGFIKPERVPLIEAGRYRECLVSARSAKEYSAQVNCGYEKPESLHMSGGGLKTAQVCKELGTGVYISNLWYCNYSDRNTCRVTGMTRYACLWVENGEPVAPLNAMRFDESMYHLLGEKLVDLTEERESLFDASTYEKRSTGGACLPGVLIDDFTFTL